MNEVEESKIAKKCEICNGELILIKEFNWKINCGCPKCHKLYELNEKEIRGEY